MARVSGRKLFLIVLVLTIKVTKKGGVSWNELTCWWYYQINQKVWTLILKEGLM